MALNAPPVFRRSLLGGGLAALAAGASACSPVALFNTVALAKVRPRVDRDIAYAPGPRGRLDIYRPAGPLSGAPLVVFIYGGGWNSGDKDMYGFAGAALASQGYVVVIADYRLYPQVRFPDFLKDQAAAIRWAYDNGARYGADPKKLILAGHSAGGYSAVMLALDPQWLAGAGLPPKAVRAAAGLAGPYDFYPFDVESTRDTFGAWPNPEQTQPIHFAKPGAPPIFLATGELDTTVRPRNAIALAAKLRAAGVEVEEKHYAGIDHVGLVKALSFPFQHDAPVLRDMAAFITRQTETASRP